MSPMIGLEASVNGEDEAPEADVVEQHLPADETEEPPDPTEALAERGIPVEAPAADVWEQLVEVPDGPEDGAASGEG